MSYAIYVLSENFVLRGLNRFASAMAEVEAHQMRKLLNTLLDELTMLYLLVISVDLWNSVIFA